ncbi:MAG: radical SAM protein [Thermoplasmata archaeon]|nr:radical SAM protein [Thermoplasmata archaeon]
METKIADKSLIMIFLLEHCNFSCPHCVREDEPMSPGYKLSFEQLKQCLEDCCKLESVKWVHFSGGEPTLWTDGKRDLADLLIAISQAGFEPGFTTNGSNFEDYDKCYDLLQKYIDRAIKPLHLYLSLDTFHNNFDIEKGRATSLDNVVKFKSNLSPEKSKLLNITVISVISKDTNSLLPDEMVEHYSSLGVKFDFVPLRPKGKARSLAHLCPDLSSAKPEDLGAYYRF